jgi:hypothetical protein
VADGFVARARPSSVTRTLERFPEDFGFQLSRVCPSKIGGHRLRPPIHPPIGAAPRSGLTPRGAWRAELLVKLLARPARPFDARVPLTSPDADAGISNQRRFGR